MISICLELISGNYTKFWKQRHPDVFTKLLFVFDKPSKSRSKMFVFVARFVSFAELKTDSKNTHKKSDVIDFPPFSTNSYIFSAKGKNFPLTFLLLFGKI